MKKKVAVVVCFVTIMVCMMGCAQLAKIKNPFECTINEGYIDVAIFGEDFNRKVFLWAEVTGGSGGYEYYYKAYEAGTERLVYTSTHPESRSITIPLKENIALDIVLTVKDSEGHEGMFEYVVERYQRK